MVNLLTIFRLPLLESIFRPRVEIGLGNRLVDALTNGLLEFKAITIFSFLFGVGLTIQAERLASGGISPWSFLLRRTAWLFLLGVLHLFLIWDGDILAFYAVCALLVIPALRLSSPVLLGLGAIAIIFPETFPSLWSVHFGANATADIAEARRIYGSGSIAEILRFRWNEIWSLIGPLLFLILPRTVGLMCWGAAAWRSGIFRDPQRHQGKLIVALVVGGIAGATLTVNGILQGSAAPILLALAYTSGLLLWFARVRGSPLPGIAAVGQMALTNYLMQSVVLGFVFYGYGFGLFGRLGSAMAACLGVALYAAQVLLSRFWLRRFCFGPAEWLWRSLSYGRQQRWLAKGGCGRVWPNPAPDRLT